MRKKRNSIKKRNDTSSKAKKTEKKKARVVAPKLRNSGTMTEGSFWGMIRHTLRKRSIFWLPITQTRNDARIPYKGPDKRRKFSFICEECKKEFAGKDVHVHHIEPCGTLMCPGDLPGFVERLFCEKPGLMLICKKCHDKKHE